MAFRFMKSADLADINFDYSKLRYPKLVSTKLDGLRGGIWEGVAMSINWKPFRNRFLQKWADQYHDLDGEFVVGSLTEGLVLERSKAITAFDGEPDFSFNVFDVIDSREPFVARLKAASVHDGDPRINVVQHYLVRSPAEALRYEELFLEQGFEGMMIRDPAGPRKEGRSTLREEWLIKVKRFEDGEGIVASVEQGYRNDNVQTRDELGRAHRSHHKDNLVLSGMVGALWLDDGHKVAPGIMTHAQRKYFWENPNQILGRKIHWRKFGYGEKDRPRHRRFYGFVEE